MLFWLSAAHAQTCDTKALVAELEQASPIAVSRSFVSLAECDRTVAKSQAKSALARMVGDKDAEPAVFWLIDLGEGDAVRTWLQGLEPHDRSRMIVALGERCATSPAVEAFLTATHSALGSRFWDERWHRGLAECRTEGIQKLLTLALDDPGIGRQAKDRAQFYGLMEVYAQNLKGAAIPTLVEVVQQSGDPKEVGVLLGTFVDAAHRGAGGLGARGSAGGVDPEVAKLAVERLDGLGPTLPAESIDQARAALEALGAHDVAERFVHYRWPDRYKDGVYVYSAVSEEVVTCKNGKKYGYFRFGEFSSANGWPDELKVRLEDILRKPWSLGEEAAKCGGTVETAVRMTEEPFDGNAQARKDWIGTELKAFQSRAAGFQKVTDVAQPPFQADAPP